MECLSECRIWFRFVALFWRPLNKPLNDRPFEQNQSNIQWAILYGKMLNHLVAFCNKMVVHLMILAQVSQFAQQKSQHLIMNIICSTTTSSPHYCTTLSMG